MQYKNAAIVLVGLAAQQAAAQDWTGASAYSCPGNTNNHCSGQQQGGYDWSGLQSGSFSSYGSNTFSGFSCSNSFGKRDLLSKRGFQSKCITGNLDDQPSISCTNDDSFSIDQMQISSSHDADIDCEYSMPDGSTCTETHSCSEGGSIFQNTQCGGAKSVTFKPGSNAPAGCSIGVHSVGFHCGSASTTVPPYSPSTSSVPAPSSTAPVSSSAPACNGGSCSSSAPVPSSSAACYGESCSSSVVPVSSSAPAPGCYGGDCSSSGVPVSSSSASPVSSSVPGYGSSSQGIPGYGSSTSKPVIPVSSSAPAPGCYGGSCSSSVVPVSSSAPAPGCYGGDCSSSGVLVSSSSASPVSSSVPGYGSSSQGIPGYGSTSSYGSSSSYGAVSSSFLGYGSSSSQGIPGYASSSSYAAVSSSFADYSSSSQGIPVYASSSSYAAVSSSAYGSSQGIPGYASSSSTLVGPVSSSTAPGPYPTPNCPGLLPRCLNTWMYMSGCKDNADSSCFCGNKQFIENVYGCISAWSGSESETQAAASYLMGLCAAHVSTNPGIITHCPSTVKPAPTPVAYSTSSAVGAVTTKPAGKPAPCTTITYSSSVVVPATYTTGVSAGFTITGSSYTTQLVTTVTVPQVQITTSTLTVGGTTTCSVGLGAGSYQSSASAYTTQAASSAGAVGSSYPSGAPASPTTAGTTFGTSWGAASASASGYPIVPATGAGVKIGSGLVSLALGAIAVLAAL